MMLMIRKEKLLAKKMCKKVKRTLFLLKISSANSFRLDDKVNVSKKRNKKEKKDGSNQKYHTAAIPADQVGMEAIERGRNQWSGRRMCACHRLSDRFRNSVWSDRWSDMLGNYVLH